MTSFNVTVQPATEPVTVAEMRAHLRLDAANLEPDPYLAPSAELAAATPGSLGAGAYRYKVTFITADGGETLAGPASTTATVTDPSTAGKINLTDLQTGGDQVMARKIYRTHADEDEGYYLLTTLNDNTTATYTDNTPDSSLGAEEPTANTTGDMEVSRLITAVRQLVELHTGLALITQTVECAMDGFCLDSQDRIMIRRRPLQSLSAITYKDLDNNFQTWGADQYDLSKGSAIQNPRIGLLYNTFFPNVQYGMDTVKVTGVFGFGDTGADVPGTLKQAMKLAAGHFYNNRELTIVGTSVEEMPLGYRALIAPYKGQQY